MKQLLFICLITVAAMGFTACDEGSNFSFSGDGEDGRITINIHDETGHLRLESRGAIAFTDDETAIKSISPGGYIKLKRNGRTLRATNDAQGDVVYELNGNKKSVLTADDRKFLGRAIKEMINVGFDAKGRTQRLYERGGSTAVLNAIDDLTNDYVKSIYFESLLNNTSLAQNELTTIARKVGTQVNSDYEKGKLLKKFSAEYLQNDATATAYLDAVNTINSDYEKAGALKNILDQPLTQSQYTQVLSITDKLGSDYEKANVLKQLIGYGIPEENNLNKFLFITANINSDYEKSNVLQQMVDQGVPSGTSFPKFLEVTGNINSDFERANVLKKLALKNITLEDQWVGLIQATEKISSDFDRSGTLVEIAKKMPNSDRVKTVYMTTAKTISSDYDYGQAIKAVR